MANEVEATELAVGDGASNAGRGQAAPDETEEPTVEVGLANVTPQQEIALRMLVSGRRVSEAAAAAGVERATLFRWRTQDANFIAALNAWRAETQAHARDRLLGLADASLRAVAGGLANGDARLGMRVLKELNCARSGPTRPIDPQEIFPDEVSEEDAHSRLGQIRQAIRGCSGWQLDNLGEVIRFGIQKHSEMIAVRVRQKLELAP